MHSISPFYHKCILNSIEQLSTSVKQLNLELEPKPLQPHQRQLSLLPGQYLDIYIPQLDSIGGFSPISLSTELPTIQLAIKESRHPVVQYLHNNSKVDDEIWVQSGGDFVY